MGDIRYWKIYERVRDASDRATMIRSLSDDEVIQALGAASLPEAKDPYLANVLASEALNRLRRARTLSQNVAEAIFQVDAEGGCLDANPAALRLVGRPLDELLGHEFARTLDLVDANDDATSTESSARREALWNEGVEGAGRIRRGDGRMLSVAYRSAPVTIDGEVVGAIVTMRDVSEETRNRALLDRTEARQRALLDSALDHAMILLDPDGIVETWNEGARQIHEYDAEEVVGRHFRSIYTMEDQRRELPEHELALAARHGRFVAEEERARRSGTSFRALVDLTAIRGESGIRGFALLEKVAGVPAPGPPFS